jgi:hypothetical protein
VSAEKAEEAVAAEEKVRLLYCYTVLLLYCYTVLLLYCYTVILLYFYTAILLYCYTIICICVSVFMYLTPFILLCGEG